jgi:hypothetical protein
MTKRFEGATIKFLIRIVTFVAFILLFQSLWGCSSGETPKNLISNGSFEENIGAWSINKNANILLTDGHPKSFFLKNLNRNSKIRLFPTFSSPNTPIKIHGSVEITHPILKKIPSCIFTYKSKGESAFPNTIPSPSWTKTVLCSGLNRIKELTYPSHLPQHTLKRSIGNNDQLQLDSNNKKYLEISLAEIIPDKVFDLFGISVIKILTEFLSIRIVVNLASYNGHVKIISNEHDLLTPVDFSDEWRDYRNIRKKNWSYTKKFDFLPLHGNQSIIVDSWKKSHITQKISGLEPGKEYLLLAGRRNVLGPVSPSVQVIEENGMVLGKAFSPLLLHEGWVRSLILFKPELKKVLVQLGGVGKNHSYPYRFANLYDDIRLYKVPEVDTEEFYRYLQTQFSILPSDISVGYKIVDYKTIMPEVFREAYYNEHASLGIPVIDLFYNSSVFWRAQLAHSVSNHHGHASILKKDPYAIIRPRKLKDLFPLQLKINNKNILALGFGFRGAGDNHFIGRNKSLKIALSKKNKMYLLNPPTRKFLSEPFSYFVSRQLGGMGMRSDFVFLRMNGKPKGISWRYWKDHSDLEFNRRPDGSLVENSIYKNILTLKEKEWNTVARSKNKKIRKQYPEKKMMALFMTLIKQDLIEYIDGLANIDKFLNWHAHSIIVSSRHQDTFHNSFFYLNYADGRLEPVPIDIKMGHWGAIDYDNNVVHFNPIIDKLLTRFKFFNQRDQAIWEYVSDSKKVKTALEYYDDLYKKNINAFIKSNMLLTGSDAPASAEEIIDSLQDGKKIFINRVKQLNRLFRENNAAAINITEYRRERDSQSTIKQLFEIKINPEKNAAWSSTVVESIELKLNDLSAKIKISPETPGKRHKNRVLFPVNEFIPSDKFFTYQISFLWEDEYLSTLEKLKNFPQQTKLIKKSYKKMSPQGYRSEGYTLVTDALKSKDTVESLLTIFTSIGKIKASKIKRFLITYEGKSPLSSQDFSFRMKNGITLDPIPTKVLFLKKNNADKNNIKNLSVKNSPVANNNKRDLLSKVIKSQSFYNNYERIYLTIEKFLETNSEFVTGNLKNNIILKAGVYKFSKTIIIPKGIELVIQPGTELRFDTGASFISYGIIRALGIKGNPIIFHGYDETTKWGVVGLLHDKARGFFENCIFEGGGEAYINGAYFSGMLAAHYADLEVRSSIFRNAGKGGGDDAINIKYGKALISDSYFFKNGGDAIDLDFAKQGSKIRGSYFLENGNDGIDASGSKVVIQNILVSKSGGKGVNLGERTHAEIDGLRVEDSKIAITSKNSSKVKLSHGVFINNSIGAMAYRKKKLYEGSEIHITNTLFEGNKFDLAAQVCSDKEKMTRKEDCSSKIYIENSKYKTHNRTFNAVIGSPSKQITSKKKYILASWRGSLPDYGYVRLSDAEIIRESPPKPLRSFVNKFEKRSKWTPSTLLTKELLEVSSATWKEKNSWYKIKRKLGLGFDLTWRYSGDLKNTILQRRFHKDLTFTETIDITFHDEVSEIALQNLICNFRISNPNSKNKWPMSTKHHQIIPRGYLVSRNSHNAVTGEGGSRNKIFKIKGKKTIRFDIGTFIRYTLSDREKVFLEEIIVSLPTSLTEVLRMRAIKSIRFQTREVNQHLDRTELTRPKVVQEKKGAQIKRSPLDVDALMAKLPE